ncbi:MAG: hypothetical protein WBK20_09065 [Spirochaetota bacterium]
MEVLIADIHADLQYLEKEKNSIVRKLKRLETEKDFENIDSHIKAIAGSLHSIYTGCENILERIIRTIDGDLPLGKDYHAVLLRRASIPIDAVRPQIITVETFAKLDELRAYRHKFRNVYLYLITPARIIELANEGISIVEQFSQDINNFCAYIQNPQQNSEK